MPTILQDLDFVQTGMAQLEAYLLSNELYWPLSGSTSLPRLTIGSLLLAVRRLTARHAFTEGSGPSPDPASTLSTVRLKWRSAWENKCRREVHARMGLWKNYLADYQQLPELQSQEFPQQVQWRVLLELLSGEFAVPPKEVEILPELDKMMQLAWLPGSFVWEMELASAFPLPEYWFLYGTLRS